MITASLHTSKHLCDQSRSLTQAHPTDLSIVNETPSRSAEIRSINTNVTEQPRRQVLETIIPRAQEKPDVRKRRHCSAGCLSAPADPSRKRAHVSAVVRSPSSDCGRWRTADQGATDSPDPCEPTKRSLSLSLSLPSVPLPPSLFPAPLPSFSRESLAFPFVCNNNVRYILAKCLGGNDESGLMQTWTGTQCCTF